MHSEEDSGSRGSSISRFWGPSRRSPCGCTVAHARQRCPRGPTSLRPRRHLLSLLFSREHGGSRGGFDVAPTLTEKLKQNRTAVSGDAHGPRWPAFPLRVRCPQNETCVPPEAGRTGRGSPHQTRPSAPRPRPPHRQPPLSSRSRLSSPRAVWCCWEASLSRGGERCRRGLLRGESGRTGRVRAQR